MKEGDIILADYRAGDPEAAAFVKLRLDDGATLDDIRSWYNKAPKKRTRLLNTDLASSVIYLQAKEALGDEARAIAYTKSRVPHLSDVSVDGPAPDTSNPDRPLFCCLQPRVDRWFSRMRGLRPCTNDELDQRMAAGGHATVNSLMRADMAISKF
jgi:hypothetical protein